MTFDVAKQKISTLLSSEKRWPVIVDFSNQSQLAEFVSYFQIGENKVLSAEQFCGVDKPLKIEELIDAIENNTGNTLIIGLSALLKLYGEECVRNTFKTILSKTPNGHVVIVSYQCKNYLKFSDERFAERNQMLFVEGELAHFPDVCFIRPSEAAAFPGSELGIEKIGCLLERATDEKVYIATDMGKADFSKSAFSLSQLNDAYEILCKRDSITHSLPKSFGTDEQWQYALSLMANGSWVSIAEKKFGSTKSILDSIGDYLGYPNEEKWLYFIMLSLFGEPSNVYVQKVLADSNDYEDFKRLLFRELLQIDRSDPSFRQYYIERKKILKSLTGAHGDVMEYCQVLATKGEHYIYYLTDLTQIEKEKIVEWLSGYGCKYSVDELIGILQDVYPDLADYLTKYRFKNELLDTYFYDYKYQKVINKVLPEFESVVEDQAQKTDFVDVLQPRATLVDKLDMTNSRAFFVDALGAEFLGFIQAKCNQYGLSVDITCGRCILPSLTCFNKDFVEFCESKNCTVVDVKDLDNVKHHGEDSFDYSKVKTPVYLIRELEIIDKLINNIKGQLYSGVFEKAIIFSDHGASRLAVLHETENLWRMATSGVHSGRCCPENEIDQKPDFAIPSKGFWVLSNYDRFQGGRKANVEVHGGATLEEVVVPIIEIKKKASHVEAFIVDATRIVTLGATETPVLRLYVGLQSDNIAVRIGETYYDAIATSEKYIYEVDLSDCAKKGCYYLDILHGSQVLSSGNMFEVKKKGMDVNDNLFDF